MSDSTPIFDWDALSRAEGEYCEAILATRGSAPELAPIAAAIAAAGGVSKGAKDFLFELRFAQALDDAGVPFQYEVAGETASTIDFGFTHGRQSWRVEMLRLGETNAAKSAIETWTDSDGVTWSSQIFTSDSDDDRETEAAETLKAIERICQKFERGGKAHKFRTVGDALHVLLVDVRAFLHGGDKFDLLHIGFGARNVPEECRQIFRGRAATGVFDPQTTLRGAAFARERLQFIGFVNDDTFTPGSFGAATSFVANPHLITNFEAAEKALSTWPLQPTVLLNGRR